MVTPSSTSDLTRAPYSTPPVGASQKVPRPPIHNPFDKFTQPQFDAWIGDITSALRHALGREEIPRTPRHEGLNGEAAKDAYEDVVEDSFAEMKARRAAKGKERATEVDEDVHSDSNEDSVYSDESEERGGRQGSEEVIEILSDDESDADVVRTHEVPDRDDAEEDAATDDGEREEDEEDEEEQAEVEASTFPPPEMPRQPPELEDAWAGPSTYAEDFYSGGDAPTAEIIDVDAEQGEEEVDLFPPPEGATQPPVLNDAWAGPSTYAEDFYSGGDVRAVEQIIDVQSEQAEEEDEPFPPAKVAVQPTELSDAWTGPRTYAEDFYSGGDVRADAAESVNAHALPGEEDESDTPVFIPGVSDELKTQDAQTLDAQTLDAQTLDAEASDHADVDVLEHLYEDLDDDEFEEVVATGSPHHEEPQQERSPPPTTLRNHVDWNWPPAFSSGRTATHSGHLEVSDEDEVPIHEIVEISDDEDDEGSDTSVVYTDDVPATQSESLVESTVADRSSVMLDSTEDIVEQPDTGVEFFTELDTYTTTQETSGYMNKKQIFEPVSPPGADFGDLPAKASKFFGPHPERRSPSMNIDEDITPPELFPHVAAVEATNHIAPKADLYEDDEPHIPNDPSVMPTVEEVLEGIVTEVEEVLDVLHEASREEEDIDVTSVAGDTSISFSMEYQVEEVVTEGRTQESEIGRTFADQSRSPSPTYLQSITDYVVTETDDISLQSDRGISESPDDVVSLHSDAGTVEIDYTVEEPHTEGHRTPSPEYSAPMASFDVPMAESSDNSVKPIVTPSAIAPSRSGRVAEEVTNAPQSQDEHPRPDQEVDVVEAKAIASSGIPMPVSADPTVPDPTSISHTPVSPSPANSESGRDESPSAAFSLSETASPVLPATTLLRGLGGQGFSGLFTPLPDGGSEHSTASSEDADLETNDLAGSMTVPETSNARECDEFTATPIADQVESIPSITEEGKNTTLKENVDEADGAELPDLPEVASTNVTLETSRSVEASTEKPVSQRPAGGSKASRDAELPGDVDADADGELDPDYVAHHNDAVLPEPLVEEEKALKITETDPFRLMGSDSKVAPGAVEDIPSPVGHEVTENTEDLRASAKPRDASPNGSAKSENDDHLREPTSPVKTTPQSDVDQGQIPDSSTRNLKRKRESPPVLPPRLTRSMAAKGNLVDQLRSPAKAKRTYTRKAKGKQQAEPAIDAEDRASASQDSEGASIKSGASIPKLDGLVPFSRHTSRSSSIVSNTPSTQSADTIPSPTLTRMPPPPFVQGILHHHHGRPTPAAAQTTQQRTVVRPPTASTDVVERNVTEAGPSQPATRSPLPSSPATRSNCRFHKVSLPREEDGPLVYFVVPGCSLSDGELMEEQHIQDLGEVTSDDASRLIRDVESLDFSPYLIGILRQLVGVDLLREQEVFYLVQPGERLKRRRSHVEKPRLSHRESLSARKLPAASPRPSESTRAMEAPSLFESASVAGSSRSHRRSDKDRSASFSESDLSDLDDDEEPTPKRQKDTHPDPVETAVEPESVDSTDKTVALTVHQMHPRRGKKLGVDTATYKPDENPTEGSSDEEQPRPRRRRDRGIKRQREEVAETQADNSGMKKRRLRTTTSGDKSIKEGGR